ncbi:DUF1217 domain-containing protein [Inquilinus limosus]|uniref:DUF1217 domain-containing protein n=1 Tax=Inquilinus limosus TaxID=171674 RepID=UPI000418AD5A|nr:DUF1217 domain-containing protein [Inquilinus limosus]
MSTLLDFQLVQRTYDRQVKLFSARPVNQREIDYFRKTIATVRTADDLMKDYRLYSFVMKAFGLEEQIPYRALIRQVIEGGTQDPKSLANRMTNKVYAELADTLNLSKDDAAKPGLTDPKEIEALVGRFVTSGIEAEQGEKNVGVRLAMYFQRKAPTITSWYQVLGDKALSEVIRTAFRIPAATAGRDIDKQKEMLERRMPIADLKDPKKVGALLQRFAIFTDMDQGTATARVPNLLVSRSASPQIITFDPATLAAATKVRLQ